MLLKSVGRLTSLFFVFLFWSSTALAWDVSLPTTSTSGNYTVSWPVDDYTFTYSLKEKVGSGSWIPVSTSGNSKSYTGKPVGTYSYLVTQRICISIFGSQSCFDNDTKTVAITVSVGAAPGVPGAISGSSSLSYTTPATGASASLSWAASSGTVTQYQLQHRLNNPLCQHSCRVI